MGPFPGVGPPVGGHRSRSAKRWFRLAGLALSAAIVGCTRLPALPGSAGEGQLYVSVRWPAPLRTQVIPTDTTEISLLITNPNVSVPAINLTRSGGQTTATASVTVPSGSYTLTATAYRYGGTEVAQGTQTAIVLPDQMSNPVITMQGTLQPVLTWYQPNGGAGQSVSMIGNNFVDPNNTFAMTLGGNAIGAFLINSDTNAAFTVPAGAANGNLVITVDGVQSPAYPFTVIASVSIVGTSSVTLYNNGSSITSATLTAAAYDPGNNPVTNPYLSWSGTNGGAISWQAYASATGSTTVFSATSSNGVSAIPTSYSGTLTVQAGNVSASIPYSIAQ